jgi:hypothetical protein
MKGCSHWADVIADCALGQQPKPDLAAHLAICPQCQDALEASRAMAARIDESLHRRAAVEPPVFAPERVMARIHAQSKTRAWWRWASAGSAVAVAMIALVLWVRRSAPPAHAVALSTWRSPTEALLRPPVAAAWATRPRLGEGFFKIKPSGEMHAQ